MALCLSESIEWNVLDTWPAGGSYLGRDAVLGTFFPALLQPFAEYAASPEAIWETGGEVVISTGFYRGRVGVSAPEFTGRFVHLWTVRDGVIVRFEQVADTATIQAALRPQTT